MIDTKKAWENLVKAGSEDEVDLTDEQMERLFRTSVASADAYLDELSDNPVTLVNLAEARLSYAKWAVESGELLAQIRLLSAMDDREIPPDADVEPVLEEVVEKAETAVMHARHLPAGAMTEELVETHHHFESIAEEGLDPAMLTIGTLFEAIPYVIMTLL